MTETVSIGIPTYNRPLGLKRTLERIARQTYTNLEIIISDNCSPGSETDDVVKKIMETDNRIKYFKQETNMGLIYNFQFVKSRATSNYFMWATDDDYFESEDLIEKLIHHAPTHILTFTNYNFISDEGTTKNFFSSIYASCETGFDYVLAFCNNGAGHPSCGMYNIPLIAKADIPLKIQEDLSYHMEGMLLHRIFDTGNIKYVDDAVINYSTYSRASSSVVPAKRVADFLTYTKRALMFYAFKSRHSVRRRLVLLKSTLVLHYNYNINELGGKKYSVHRFSLFLFLCKVLQARK